MEVTLSKTPLNIMYFGDEEMSNENEETEAKCVKLQLKENIAAYIDKRELIRSSDPLVCNNALKEKVASNYVIVKQIISNLSWQDKLICKLVCSTWYSAVQALQKELLSPEDFVVDLHCSFKSGGKGWFKQSGIPNTEPLAIFTFANSAGFMGLSKCKVISPRPCEQPCLKEHSLLDLVNRQFNAPKNCMLTVRANYLVYRPLPRSITYRHSINQYKFTWNSLFLSGLFIPNIPNVGFKLLNISSQSQECLQQQFYSVVDKVSKDHIIKGVLVYVTEKYLLNSVEDIVFLNYFKEVQPNIPYALGGCIIEDTLSEESEINHLIDNINKGADYISENLLSIGLFTVPKTTSDIENNFEMYSFVIDSSQWTKEKIQESVAEFSKKVPRFEHSVALKLSCVGRDQKHAMEQDFFREAFPNTSIVGCYGNGELGVYHPSKPASIPFPLTMKRRRREPGPQFGIIYSYSTVFVYIGWGKVTSPKGPVNK
ncbi:uncharacterized protein [Battus philenor]|uniref:uncharacterized protein n=1 Tax=Battus philenor TaxID=42288 RepID=UPI0035CFA82A